MTVSQGHNVLQPHMQMHSSENPHTRRHCGYFPFNHPSAAERRANTSLCFLETRESVKPHHTWFYLQSTFLTESLFLSLFLVLFLTLVLVQINNRKQVVYKLQASPTKFVKRESIFREQWRPEQVSIDRVDDPSELLWLEDRKSVV